MMLVIVVMAWAASELSFAEKVAVSAAVLVFLQFLLWMLTGVAFGLRLLTEPTLRAKFKKASTSERVELLLLRD
jgi:uncharacterized membrane protein YhhN